MHNHMDANGTSHGEPHQTSQRHVHILIVGGGLTGLIFAQGLRKFNASPEAATYHTRYTYTVFEREPYVFYRGGGYSLTLHWSLEHLDTVLPQDVLDGFNDCLCNPHFVESGEASKFMYLNLRTKEPVFEAPIPPIRVARVSRTKLINLLLTGLDVQYSKTLSDISWPSHDTVTAHFQDGTSQQGNLLIGADGSNSVVRRLLCGPKAVSTPVAVRAIGIRCYYPVSKIKKCQDVDKNIIHGGDPQNNTYWWFSLLDMPRPDSGIDMAQCYLTLNWPYEDEYLGRGKPTDVPSTKEERLDFQRMLADGWAEPMREMVYDLPDTCEVHEIKLMEWAPQEDTWDNHSGTVTMIGDAAHAMTPFRGEASNHGILDACNVLNMLFGQKDYGSSSDELDLPALVTSYEKEMVVRVAPAIKRSTQACLDATHFDRMSTGSFFVANRFEKGK